MKKFPILAYMNANDNIQLESDTDITTSEDFYEKRGRFENEFIGVAKDLDGLFELINNFT